MASYAILGSTGNCGTAILQLLLREPNVKIQAYCRNKSKLLRLSPEVATNERVEIFEGDIRDVDLLVSCLRGCRAVFMAVSTNDNIPDYRAGQDVAIASIRALSRLKQLEDAKMPKLILLSSATVDNTLSRKTPYLLRLILHRSASHVYHDLVETEKLLRAEEDWLTTVFIKPGALSVDEQRGHALSLTDADNPVSYLDLAAAMIEAADDQEGLYDMQNLGVINTNGAATFPSGTPLCILLGLLRHFFPVLHPYLPSTGA
ncbi:hypothetical protein NQ176_g2604 [Zarea fungicola]|uniref:Uncharacterized protein n=1 Tax=Zarea fungicola TaxID=93591 RepID=A0ACC1NPH9_9HYPO|nr:hypothetical protein NQ176_g2604 [Lecanicillium fungicola]